MDKQINQKAGAFLKKKKQRKNWEKAVSVIAAVVVFCTTYALILPAITLSAQLVCEIDEHTHTEECYIEEQVLSCEIPEGEGHTHTDACYGTEEIKTLLCELEEDENHTHSDECYTMEKPLICEQEEMEEHTHTEECYTTSKTLKCELTEHVHTEECYASAENTETKVSLFSADGEVNTEPVENFMLWLYVKDSSAGTTTKIKGYAKNLVTWETDDSEEGLKNVVLRRTDGDGDTYLIPITYFVNNYASYGYSFTFSEGEACPFTYKPNAAEESTDDFQQASYIQVGDDWYVQIQDTGNYEDPDCPRSNIYYKYNGGTEEPVQDYSKTVSKEQLTLYSGQVYSMGVPTMSELTNAEDSIASAKIEEKAILQLGKDKDYTGDFVDISNAHYTFAGNTTEGYTVKAESGDIYLSLADAKIPGAGTVATIKLEAKGNNCFGIKKDETNYLYFWRDGKNYFDKYSKYDGEGCPFYIYKQVQSTEASSAEIPGYAQIASVSEISSDGSYLIAAEANSAYYVLYPSTASGSTEAVYCSHVAKVLPYTLNITANEQGTTTVSAENKEIEVTVKNQISLYEGETIEIQLPAGATVQRIDGTNDAATITVEENGLCTIHGETKGNITAEVAVGDETYFWNIHVGRTFFKLQYDNFTVTFYLKDTEGNSIECDDVDDIDGISKCRYIFTSDSQSSGEDIKVGVAPVIEDYTYKGAWIPNDSIIYSVEKISTEELRFYYTEPVMSGQWTTKKLQNGSEYSVDLYYTKTVTSTANHGVTTINLFDYWTVTQDAVDAPASPYLEAQCTLVDKLEEGINANRGLKFKSGNGRDDSASDANKWTGSAAPCSGIVNPTLMDGYPTLTGNKNLSGYAGNSLDYLFDPNYDVYTENDDGTVSYYKASYPNVKNLLQMEDGYYYYDCTKNYAEFDGTDSFTLYTSPALNAGDQKEGQFFPFNPIEDAMGLSGTNAAYNQKLNHYFGMTMSTHFMQQYGGKTSAIDTNAKDTIFEFSGDDDVWIFIDGVLVADLGGIHNAASVAINFATGQVTINGNSSTTLHRAFSSAGCENSTTWSQTNEATFADGTTHRLDFFYLERGNNESNLHLKFNLVEIPATSIYKVNQYGDPVAGAAFAVYKADENWNYYYTDANGNLVSEEENALYLNSTDLAACTIDKSTGIISKDDANIICPVYIGTSDSKGEMIFADDTGAPLSLSQLRERFGTHFILREINIPDGYRTISDEIRLYITSESSVGTVLQCANTYDTGVWASGTLLVNARDTLYGNGIERKNYYTVEDGQVNVNGTLFGVVFKYVGPIDDGNATGLGEQENWVPVYGSDLDGYQTVDWWNAYISEEEKVDAAIEAAIKAAKKAQDYGNVVFSPSADNSMQLYLTNLPGNVETYSRMTTGEPGRTRYTVGYYWTEGSLTQATSENTYRVFTDESEFGNIIDVPEGYQAFTRTFGATIEVPNLTNRLLVQKLDEEGELVNNATFAMYNIEEVTEKTGEGDEKAISAIYYLGEDANGNEVKIYLGKDEDGDNQGKAWLQADWSVWLLKAANTGTDEAENAGAYKIDDALGVISVTINSVNYTIKPVQIDKTRYQAGEQGTASFDEMSTGGYYYVREISAPEVYQLNTTEIMVRVTDDAVLANAGTVDDGVTVARGPGYAVASLNQFASQGKIDNTLTWIITHLKITDVSNSFDVTTKESYYSDESVWKYTEGNYADDTTHLTTDRKGAYGVHLVYDPSDTANTIFNYTINEGSYDPELSDNVTRRLYTKIGWSYLEIYQDYEYGKVESAKNGAGYEKLVDEQGEDMEISGLFSRSVYIQVTNPYKTVDLTVKKADADNEDLLLHDAKFVVYKQVGGEQLYYQYTEATNTTVWVTDRNDATTLTTGSDDANKGQFKLHNLNAGTFYLEETEAPAGYSKLDNAIKFTVNFTDGEGKIGSAEWAVENTSDMNPVVEEDGITLRVPNTVITTTVAVTKVWKGSEQEITLKLYRKAKGQGEAELVDTRTLSDNDKDSVKISDVISGATCTWDTTNEKWEIKWTELPAYGLVDETMTEYSWYIQEEPVDGYYTSYSKVTEELTVDTENTENTEKIFAAEAVADEADGIKKVTVTNKSGYELPAAGGKGTAGLAVSGIALMLAAGMGELCIAKRRKNK